MKTCEYCGAKLFFPCQNEQDENQCLEKHIGEDINKDNTK